ncbi:MAG: glycoside hydrolase family 2 TIM barrel-domain containing protein [Chitinophagales bacterium]
MPENSAVKNTYHLLKQSQHHFLNVKQGLRLITFFSFLLLASVQAQTVWSTEKATDWYHRQDWLRGCNFIPSTAVNQLEMWQQETFDTVTIDRELGYAENIGFNCVRVFLHHVAWQIDMAGFKNRINTYLTIAERHHIKTMFVFFDDCWNATYQAGTQPDSRPGIHNSGWVRDPGRLLYKNRKALYPILESYVKDILTTFKNDERVLMWDLYNEPGNSGNGPRSMPLLKKVFSWAHESKPTQPVTAGVWISMFHRLYSYQLHQSDIITYHNYGQPKIHAAVIRKLKKYNRPLICTEYMARTFNSTFFNIMPLLKKENVGAINWGLVAGKTNTKYAWASPVPSGAEPKEWFHEIFRTDGTPYNAKEIDLIKSLTGP